MLNHILKFKELNYIGSNDSYSHPFIYVNNFLRTHTTQREAELILNSLILDISHFHPWTCKLALKASLFLKQRNAFIVKRYVLNI